MKNHVLRPLWVAIAFVALILLARYILVPKDFGVQDDSFTYNFHRASNVQEWKDFPVKYEGHEVCIECHEEKGESLAASPHESIECENCHGPGNAHIDSESAADITIDMRRELCLRCHSDLGYVGINRSSIPGIDPKEHNVDSECAECHNPHNPDLEEM